MSLYEFSIYLDRIPSDREVDALFDAGFDDSAPGTERGRGVIYVSREAPSLATAILSAVDQAGTAGFRVVAVRDEDLHSLKHIAERLGRSYESLRLLASGKRGGGGFPPPVTGDGWALYSWTAVAEWARDNLASEVVVDDHVRVLAAADHLLRARAIMPDLSSVMPLAG